MNTTARTLLIALFLASAPVFAQVRAATVFFVPWEAEIAAPLGPSSVREFSSVRTEILDESIARSLQEWLTSESFTSPSSPNRYQPINLRLVIDFTLENGSIESYYANRDRLVEVKSGKAREIDEAFRSRFSSFSSLKFR